MRSIRNNKPIIIFILVLGLFGSVYSEDIPTETIKLSLEDVSRLAIENSLDIQIAQYDAYISRTSLDDARSIFDTIFTAEASYNRNKKAQANSIAGSDAKEHSFSLGLEKKLPTGTTLSLDAIATKTKTNSAFSTLNPYNEALVGLTVKQEIGKNFFGLADRADIKLTELDIENSEFTSLDDIEEIVYKAQKAYWNLVLKDEEVVIREDIFKTAKRLHEIYKNKNSIGLVEESELLAIEALVYTRESDLTVANLGQETAKNELLFLLNKGDFKNKVKPKDKINVEPSTVNLYRVLEEAINSRRDYKRIRNELKKSEIDLVVKENALWPQIDLEATFARNNINADRGSAWEGLSSNANDEIALTLTIEVPLENREAKSELEKIRLEDSQLLLRLKRVERLILQEINDKVNQVNSSDNQIRLYQSIIKLHQRKLDNQIKRIGYGRSNADTLIQYEDDLLKARLALATNSYTYKVALIELDLVKNVLLDKYWEEPL
ncbi:MAG: TolC family protein [Candidatus Omnitrophica bacterium]|nr:TolC family protein [Candidatus Omnitrophota bacterium]